MTTPKKPSAGDDIDSRCLKCKALTNHTIIAMVGDKVAKVQCNTCGGRHNYRPALAEKKTVAIRRSAGRTSASPARKPSARHTTEPVAATFAEQLADRDFSTAKPYSMSGNFAVDDLIDHPTFGFGVVIKKIGPNKIEVLFREQTRILICEKH
ncbi:MAG: hypothetical protein ACOY4H_04725 [Thermodesulfobacteriota bacterium]